MKLRYSFVSLIFIISACTASKTGSYNTNIAKLAPTMLNQYFEINNCNSIESTEVIGKLVVTDADEESLTQEHWRVKGCGQIYNFKISLAGDGEDIKLENMADL